MSDHLPECADEIRVTVSFGDRAGQCDTCNALRACEQRTLQAARDAVAALRISPQDWDYTSSQSYGDIRHEAWQEALAAIDTLRGEA